MSVVVRDEHLIDRAAMAAMKLMLRGSKGSVGGPPARQDFDTLMERTPASDDVTYEAETVGGVQGWWCRPRDANDGTAILYLHGGGYVAGSARAYRNFVGQIAQRARSAAFVPDYALGPERRFPAALDDARAAFAGLSASRVAVAGDSAGGGLALALLAAARTEGRPPVAAAVMSPWTDLALTGDSMKDRADADPLFTREALTSMARHYLGDADPRDARASPLYGEMAGLPPIVIHVGDDEVLRDDAVRYAERVASAGGSVEVQVWKGMIHVFPANMSLLKAAREALDGIGAFLARCFAAGSVVTGLGPGHLRTAFEPIRRNVPHRSPRPGSHALFRLRR